MTAKKLEGGMINNAPAAPKEPGSQRLQSSKHSGDEESNDTECIMMVELRTLLSFSDSES